jgi:hypothetical protein
VCVVLLPAACSYLHNNNIVHGDLVSAFCLAAEAMPAAEHATEVCSQHCALVVPGCRQFHTL